MRTCREDRFGSWAELAAATVEGVDYELLLRPVSASPSCCVIAIHGGGIEPGTTELAVGIAGEEHSLASVVGLRRSRNGELHITSTRFDQPDIVALVERSDTVVSLHGCEGDENDAIELGGLDLILRNDMLHELGMAGFTARIASAAHRFAAAQPENICNRTAQTRRAGGVQLELPHGLRRRFFADGDVSRAGRSHTTPHFAAFVSAARRALAQRLLRAPL